MEKRKISEENRLLENKINSIIKMDSLPQGLTFRYRTGTEHIPENIIAYRCRFARGGITHSRNFNTSNYKTMDDALSDALDWLYDNKVRTDLLGVEYDDLIRPRVKGIHLELKQSPTNEDPDNVFPRYCVSYWDGEFLRKRTMRIYRDTDHDGNYMLNEALRFKLKKLKEGQTNGNS